MIGYVNQNLKSRKREVRFDLKRKCCQSWVEVEYESAASSFNQIITTADGREDAQDTIVQPQPDGRDSHGGEIRRVGAGRGARDGLGGGKGIRSREGGARPSSAVAGEEVPRRQL